MLASLFDAQEQTRPARFQVLLDTDSTEGGIVCFAFEERPGAWWEDVSVTEAVQFVSCDGYRPLVRLVGGKAD